MEIQKIKIKSDYKLADIVYEVERGILRIPQFQREFVWQKSRVIKLLESIYQEYSIGSFFFWNAPENYYDFYRDIAELHLPQPDKHDKITYILDGQQRLTSLYVTIKGLTLFGKDYRTICFDLDFKTFVDRRPDNKRFISVSDLLSEAEASDELYETLNSERKKVWRDCNRHFTNYPFSAIEVRDKDLDEVCEIFERINQGGQKLNLFDLVAARVWTPEFDLRKAVNQISSEFKDKGFKDVTNEVFLQTLSLIAKGSCTRVVQLQLRSEDVARVWQATVDALNLATDYVRHNFGVVNSLFLPYPSMLAVIAYLFYQNDSRSLNHRQTELLAKWFWQTAFAERYGASILTLMTEDRKLMDQIAQGEEPDINYSFWLDIDALIKIRMYRKSAIKNAVLCLLARKNPRHFKNNALLPLGEEYFSVFNNAERHHIFPASIVKKSYPQAMVHSLPNFCFIPAELNKEISNQKPSAYFEKYSLINPDFSDTLATHLIPYTEAVKTDNFMSFLASRAALLLDEITHITGSKMSQLIADNINKAIDTTEQQLRDIINTKLLELDPNYWRTKVPGDIGGNVKKRILEDIRKNPGKQIADYTARDWLEFCDIMDYQKIITSNWDVFGSLFRGKSETERRFLSLKEFRNAVKHGRGEVASFIQKEGEAALEWLEIILSQQQEKQRTLNLTPDEESLARTARKSEFVQRMIKEIPQWLEQGCKGGRITLKDGLPDNDRYIREGKQLCMWFYYAKDWVFMELHRTTPEELQLLKTLTKPESILERGYQGQVRFHLTNDHDFEIIKNIIITRNTR